MTSLSPVIVIGGGISGLVCAHALTQAGIDALVLEASPRAGGMIRSERRDGFLLELGPQSFSGTAPLRTLTADLGIADQLVQASPTAPRYVLLAGALQAVPLNPAALLTSSLLSARTKWNLARDIFGTTSALEYDESIADFTRRKFGNQLLDRLVGPFVSGIYAGDPERLSLRSSFPRLHEAEKSAGSVVRGMVQGMRRAAKSRKGPREKPSLLSFRDGNETLVRALSEKLAARLRLGAQVLRIGASREAGAITFDVQISQSGKEEQLRASRLVLATPADVAGVLLRDLNAAFEPVLAGIEYAPVAVVSLGYRQEDIGHSLHGFGFLAPRSSGLRLLGCVWNSSLFPGRAPAGHALLTCFVGGATDPSAAALPHEDLAQLVHRELVPLLALQAPPGFSHVQMYRHALPQYNLGHLERLTALEQLRAIFPGLFFVGNYLRGPAIGDCVDLGKTVAADIIGQLHSA